MNWWSQLNNVTNVRSIAVNNTASYFYGCGDSFDNEDYSGVNDPKVNATYSAAIFKMTN